MVGFGSSLRMGRRSGWEAAYLDYEHLKLLLSQIEAFYEHENHHHGFGGGRNMEDVTTRDFRDELFLESDSDKAFASSVQELEEEEEPPISLRMRFLRHHSSACRTKVVSMVIPIATTPPKKNI